MLKKLGGGSGAEAGRAQRLARFPDLRLYGDEFVFNVVSGMFYRLTPTAAILLRLFGSGCGAEDLVEKLQTEYGASRSVALRDVEFFLNDLESLGISDLPPVQSLPARSA